MYERDLSVSARSSRGKPMYGSKSSAGYASLGPPLKDEKCLRSLRFRTGGLEAASLSVAPQNTTA